MNKKFKVILSSLGLFFSIQSAQAGILSYMIKHPIHTSVIGVISRG